MYKMNLQDVILMYSFFYLVNQKKFKRINIKKHSY